MAGTTQDFSVQDEGSIVLIRPLTDAAREWIAEEVNADDAQWFAGALAVERRYAGDILDGMSFAGLVRS